MWYGGGGRVLVDLVCVGVTNENGSRLEVAMGHHRNLIIKQEQGCSSPLCWSLSLLVLNLFAAVTEVCSTSLVVVVSYCM